MFVKLGRLIGELQSDHTALVDAWRLIFDRCRVDAGRPDIRLRGRVVDRLPPPPASAPFFVGDPPAGGRGPRLAVYRRDDGRVQLDLPGGARIATPLGAAATDPAAFAELTVTPPWLPGARLEDVTTIALAPLLRARGYYWLHAFAVVDADRALLIVGASGSGKTTTGLSLLAAGARFLANDAVLLARRPEGVTAYPSPGLVNITPDSLAHAPGPAAALAGRAADAISGKIHLTTSELLGALNATAGEAARVAAVYFPRVGASAPSTATPLPTAVAMARLMVESVDHWDEPTLSDHLALLQALSKQAAPYELRLGRDLGGLAARLLT